MQMIITSCFIGIISCSLAMARPQGTFNNYPYRPTFSDLDPYNNYYNYYSTAAPYQQNSMRIWPYIIDQAVSPLYNWNWNGNGYNGASNGYNGYNPNNNGYYNSNTNNGYYNPFNLGYTTSNPYGSIYNSYGTYTGKK